jgi:hypothetical protein
MALGLAGVQATSYQCSRHIIDLPYLSITWMSRVSGNTGVYDVEHVIHRLLYKKVISLHWVPLLCMRERATLRLLG